MAKGGKGGFEAEQPVPAGKPETVDKYAETTKSPEIAQQDKIMPFSGAMAKEESRREAPSATLKARTLKLIVKRLKKP